jgi:acyl-coenzyme A thioesterase PaaI-like protein
MNPRQVAEYMFDQDYFSQWMNIKLIEVKENYCLIEMPIKKEMINGLKRFTEVLHLLLQILHWHFRPTIPEMQPLH